jgi:hypothetical protein
MFAKKGLSPYSHLCCHFNRTLMFINVNSCCYAVVVDSLPMRMKKKSLYITTSSSSTEPSFRFTVHWLETPARLRAIGFLIDLIHLW